MTITTIQKIIKIGSSQGVTIPAKDLRALGIKAGNEVKITVEPTVPKEALADEYEAFKARYGETLKNLAGR